MVYGQAKTYYFFYDRFLT